MNDEIKGSKKKRPYPYTIKPFNLDWVKDEKALSRASILEFLRVEALLRSPKIHKLYEMSGKGRAETLLFKEYGISWEVLWGSHHSDLDQSEDRLKQYNSGAYETPVCDIKADVLNSREKEKRAESWKRAILRSSHEPDIADGSLIFQLNVLHSPETIIKKLRPLLQKAHADYSQKKPFLTGWAMRRQFSLDGPFVEGPEFPIFNESKVPKKGLRKWLNYFHWYDRHYRDRLTQEQVTEEAFSLSYAYIAKELARVSQGISRAKKMIKAAETCQWPPSIFPA